MKNIFYKFLCISLLSYTTTYSQCWSSISSNYYNQLAIKTDGTLWAWGYNYFGQLGIADNYTTNLQSNTPAQVGSDSNWSQVSCGGRHTLALKTNGTIWSWGDNQFGELGDGTTTTRYNPMQIGSATNWKSVSASNLFSVAIKTDGTLWAWGINTFGTLGDGTNTTRYIPVQVGSSTDWKTVSVASTSGHVIALKNNGTIWAWGRNTYGSLGDGTTIDKNSPVQIGTATDWKEIVDGGEYTIGLKTNGTLWSWGLNDTGQLGIGTTINRLSPGQIGTATDWKSISSQDFVSTSFAYKMDNSLWGWGMNENWQLGNGNNTNSLNPIQIGTNLNWKYISPAGIRTWTINQDSSLWFAGSNDGIFPSFTLTGPCSVLSLSQNILKDLTIYPNPTHDYINISINQDEKISKVKIQNLLGQEIEGSYEDNNIINVQNFQTGVYLIEIITNKEQYFLKFIKN